MTVAGPPGQQNGRRAASGANRFRLRAYYAPVAPRPQARLEKPAAWQETNPDDTNQLTGPVERPERGEHDHVARIATVRNREDSHRHPQPLPPGQHTAK